MWPLCIFSHIEPFERPSCLCCYFKEILLSAHTRQLDSLDLLCFLPSLSSSLLRGTNLQFSPILLPMVTCRHSPGRRSRIPSVLPCKVTWSQEGHPLTTAIFLVRAMQGLQDSFRSVCYRYQAGVWSRSRHLEQEGGMMGQVWSR